MNWDLTMVSLERFVCSWSLLNLCNDLEYLKLLWNEIAWWLCSAGIALNLFAFASFCTSVKLALLNYRNEWPSCYRCCTPSYSVTERSLILLLSTSYALSCQESSFYLQVLIITPSWLIYLSNHIAGENENRAPKSMQRSEYDIYLCRHTSHCQLRIVMHIDWLQIWANDKIAYVGFEPTSLCIIAHCSTIELIG